ncbi:MAG: GumC family protein, partial [Janthinobacterium lividum]
SARLQPKIYVATGLISVETQHVAIPELQSAIDPVNSPDPMPGLRSEVQVLTSPALLQQLVEAMHLADDPEFNGSLRPPTFQDRAKGWLWSQVYRVIPALAPDVATDETAGGASQGASAAASRGVRLPSSRSQMHDAVLASVSHALKVTNDGRSLIVTVEFSSVDPVLASDFVNTLVARYLAERGAARESLNREANSALTGRLQAVREDIQGLETKLVDLRSRNNLVQLRAGSLDQQKLENLSMALTQATAQRIQADAEWQQANATASGGLVTSDANVIASPTIGRLRDQETIAQGRIAELSNRYGPGYPLLQAAQAQLGSVRAQIGAEARRVSGALRTQAQASHAREDALKQQVAQANQSAAGMSTVQSQIEQIEKDLDARRQVYKTLLSGVDQTNSDNHGLRPPDARVVSAATPPGFPASPKPKLSAAFGLVGGFAIGSVLVLLRGSRGLRTAAEVFEQSGLQCVAAIRNPGGRKPGDRLLACAVADPTGLLAEEFRGLRARLRFVPAGLTVPRAVVFTSSRAGEGASTLAAAFSRVAAVDGLKVLLLDGDLQDPALGVLLGRQDGQLADVLGGRVAWRDAVQHDTLTDMDLILASGSEDGSHAALSGIRFRNVLSEASREYDLVVIDAPPIELSADALVLVDLADVAVLVVEAGATKAKTLQEAVERIGNASATHAVTVLNKASVA